MARAKTKKRASSKKTVARRAPSASSTTKEQTFLLWFAVALFVLAMYLVFTKQ